MGLLQWLEQHLLSCPYKATLGMDCPGCGFQRALISLIKGDFAESFAMYPALLPILAMFALLALHLKFSFKHGALALKILFFVNAALVIGAWVYKMVNGAHIH